MANNVALIADPLEKAAKHLNLNIKVRDPEHTAISSPDLLEKIKTEMQAHFKDVTILELANREN